MTQWYDNNFAADNSSRGVSKPEKEITEDHRYPRNPDEYPTYEWVVAEKPPLGKVVWLDPWYVRVYRKILNKLHR